MLDSQLVMDHILVADLQASRIFKIKQETDEDD
jgi:hypothetical protein